MVHMLVNVMRMIESIPPCGGCCQHGFIHRGEYVLYINLWIEVFWLDRAENGITEEWRPVIAVMS